MNEKKAVKTIAMLPTPILRFATRPIPLAVILRNRMRPGAKITVLQQLYKEKDGDKAMWADIPKVLLDEQGKEIVPKKEN